MTVIVEIGPNEKPMYILSEEVLHKIKAGGIYLGIDIMEYTFSKSSLKENGQAVLGDVNKLPLLESSVDEFWLMNVLSRLLTPHGALHPFIDYERIFSELSRATKKGGIINIGNTYLSLFPEHDLSLMNADFSHLGLEKEVFTGPEIERFLARYRMHTEVYGSKPFFMSLTKN